MGPDLGEPKARQRVPLVPSGSTKCAHKRAKVLANDQGR
jgi:hypothetical protein